MSIKQLNAKYFLNEDRILLRMNTLDQSEYKFWLTRRVTHYILKSAFELFEKDYQAKADVEKEPSDQWHYFNPQHFLKFFYSSFALTFLFQPTSAVSM